MHFQLEQTQGKLVGVTFGEVYDVAIDIRKDSPSYGQWFVLLLSAKNMLQLWVTAGFAHG
jgi:dTDP-4-dehydrorhamnose 3,5-epimerase